MRVLLALAIPFAGLAQDVTWREVAPLFDRYCNSCHRAGQVGPFDFTTFEGASAYAPEIARYILGNKMPPWRAKASPLAFSNSKALPDSATAAILKWINTGTRPGNAPPLPKRNPQWNLGTPDLILSQPKEHTVSAEKTVEIVQFTIPPAELGNTNKDLYFNAFELRPSNRNLLHHAILKLAGQPIAAAAMCDTGIRLPSGIGWHIPKGTALTVELHYFKRNLRPARDLTRLALFFTPQRPQRIASLLELTKPELRIPAGANLHPEQTTFTVPNDVSLLGILPVFQLLAADVRLKQKGNRDYFLWVEPFEHHLMSSYFLSRPLPLRRGSILQAEAIFDNSTQNPYNPHQQLREVRFAENGLDETFRFWLTVAR
jgi:hypothetical protein